MTEIEVKALVTNLGKYNEGKLLGEWVTFPINEEEQEELFKRIGINDENYEEYFMSDFDSALPLYSNYGEEVRIETLNELAEDVNYFLPHEQEKLLAILDGVTEDIANAICYMSNYEFYKGMDAVEYEKHYVDEMYSDLIDRIESSGIGPYIYIDYDELAQFDDTLTVVDSGVLVER